MDLIIKNKIIAAPIETIITLLRAETGNKYFKFIGKSNSEYLKCTCAFHKNGEENHPSAGFYNKIDGDREYGFFYCFTCGKKVPLYTVVGYCFGKDDEFGKNWLVDNFGSIVLSTRYLKPLNLNKKEAKKEIIDESILDTFESYHPYMLERKLSKDVIDKYRIGFDPQSNSLTFPCWDINSNLVEINKRSISGKRFLLLSNVNKEVYLLNFAVKERATSVYITESLINCLTLMSWFKDKHAVALMGTGTKIQYSILKKSGIRSFILCLDGDLAGRLGTVRFITALKDNSLISIIDIPDGKDVNDLTKDEFLLCKDLSISEWCNKYNMKIS